MPSSSTRLAVEAALRVPVGFTVTWWSPAPTPVRTYTRFAFWTVGEYRSTVVSAPPSSWNVMRPMFGPLVATIPTMLPAENVCFGLLALSPDSCAQRTEPPNVPAEARFVHVPPYAICAVWALSVGDSVNRCPRA